MCPNSRVNVLLSYLEPWGGGAVIASLASVLVEMKLICFGGDGRVLVGGAAEGAHSVLVEPVGGNVKSHLSLGGGTEGGEEASG